MARLVTYFLCAAIVATLAGGLGGSFQPARVVLAISVLMTFVLSTNVGTLAPVTRQALTFLAVILLAGTLSLSWTTDFIGGLGLLIAVAVGGSAFYVVSRADLTLQGVRLLIGSWVVAVGLSMPIAFYEISTGTHFQFALEDRIIGGIGEFPFASIFFGNYNDYSAWLCLAFPITMAAFFEVKTWSSKAFIVMINILVVSVVFINTSRAALAYVALVVIAYMVISNRFRLMAAVATAILVPVAIAKYQGRLLDLYDLAVYRFQVVGAVDESYIQRSGLIENGTMAIIESYGIGIGAGGFDEYMNDNFPYFIPNPHNLLLEIGINFGVIPLVMFLILIFKLFWIGLSRKDLPVSFRLALVLGAVSVPIIGAVPSQAVGYVYWWVWLATMVAIASARTADQAATYDTTRDLRTREWAAQ